MTGAAALAVLWPLSRRADLKVGGELAIYKDQLAEIDRDGNAGRIADTEAAAARVEVSRRILAAEAAAIASPSHQPVETRRRRMIALAALILLPAVTLGLYVKLGSPALPGEPLSARLSAPPEQRSITTLVAQVEAHLATNPEDGRGWEVLAPVYIRTGRFDDAVKARRAASRLLGVTAAREADLGEAIVAVGNGIVTAEAKSAFERALALDPRAVKPRFFLGLAAEQDGQAAAAVATWRALLAEAPSDAGWTEFVQAALARVEPQSPGNLPGPTAEDLAAAEQLSPQQRLDMARGMIERLAGRLRDDVSDFEGWLRLVRAYSVLGDKDKARAAAVDARRALGGDAEKVRRLDELVRSLGLEG